jgi:hypothetical protein
MDWWNELCVQNRQVFGLHRLNEKNMPYVRTLFKVQSIQDFGLPFWHLQTLLQSILRGYYMAMFLSRPKSTRGSHISAPEG